MKDRSSPVDGGIIGSNRGDHFPTPGRSRPGFKRQFLHRAQQALYLSGLAGINARFANPDGALILYYHSIVDEELSAFVAPDNSITKAQFETQLRYLKQHCEVISLAHLIDCFNEDRELPERAAVITFDDGYHDNLKIAAPLLEKYDLPATLFLCTGYVERREAQWIDELYTMFSWRSCHRLDLPKLGVACDLGEKDQMTWSYDAISDKLLGSGQKSRRHLLDEINAQLQPRRDMPQLTLGWDDVRQLKRQYPLFEIGLHTRDHMDLSRLDDEQARVEIQRSQSDYEKEMGESARFFSYPYGRNNQLVRDCVRDLGFEGAVATMPTALASRTDDRFALPRFETSPSKLDLQLWMTGSFPQLSKRFFGRVYE